MMSKVILSSIQRRMMKNAEATLSMDDLLLTTASRLQVQLQHCPNSVHHFLNTLSNTSNVCSQTLLPASLFRNSSSNFRSPTVSPWGPSK